MIQKLIKRKLTFLMYESVASLNELERQTDFNGFLFYTNKVLRVENSNQLLYEYDKYIDSFTSAIKAEFYSACFTLENYLYKLFDKASYETNFAICLAKLNDYLSVYKENLIAQAGLQVDTFLLSTQGEIH